MTRFIVVHEFAHGGWTFRCSDEPYTLDELNDRAIDGDVLAQYRRRGMLTTEEEAAANRAEASRLALEAAASAPPPPPAHTGPED